VVQAAFGINLDNNLMAVVFPGTIKRILKTTLLQTPFWSFTAAIPSPPAPLPGKVVGCAACTIVAFTNITAFRATINGHAEATPVAAPNGR
jgi:hypothetical protein